MFIVGGCQDLLNVLTLAVCVKGTNNAAFQRCNVGFRNSKQLLELDREQ